MQDPGRGEPTARMSRRQLSGAGAIGAALERGEAARLIVVREGARGAPVERLLARAREAGIPVQRAGARDFDRLRGSATARDALAMLGARPDAGMDEVLRGPGAAWLLSGVAYPGNAGFAVRTAEVSGAAGVFLDSPFDRDQRRDALRASMRADRFLPVFWKRTDVVLAAAIQSGRRIVGIEDVGRQAPWEVDLSGPVLFVVGGEADGIPEAALARCDHVVRIPMAGFIRSYNLQAAVAVVSAERMRQLGGAPG
jgi:tRNA G18 (ribose-2'-O)-methylase SpoU